MTKLTSLHIFQSLEKQNVDAGTESVNLQNSQELEQGLLWLVSTIDFYRETAPYYDIPQEFFPGYVSYNTTYSIRFLFALAAQWTKFRQNFLGQHWVWRARDQLCQSVPQNGLNFFIFVMASGFKQKDLTD